MRTPFLSSSAAPHTRPDVSGPALARRYLLVTPSTAHGFWLAGALGDMAEVVPVGFDAAVLHAQLAQTRPLAVVVDFSPPETERAAALVQSLHREWPGLALVGAGTGSHAQVTLMALRAGVSDFVDFDSPESEARAVLERLAQSASSGTALAAAHSQTPHFVLPLLGARAGLGVSTLAVHLAVMLQEMQAQGRAGAKSGPGLPSAGQAQHAALLDLGLPARDGQLYLDVNSPYSFVDAVHNHQQRRLDATLLESTVGRHSTGMATLSWPADLASLRDVSPAAAAALVQGLKAFFRAQIVDLGGLSQQEFLLPMLRQSQQAWVVCDQSIGGIVSTAQLLQELEAQGVQRSGLRLVVNRFHAHAGLPARDLAKRLGLELLHVVPERGTALLAAMSKGQLLSQTMRADPYVHSVRQMARSLLVSAKTPTPDAHSGAPALQRLTQWVQRWRP